MLLQVTELDAGYGQKRVIHGASLHVGEREIVAVLGHNGAGKSTLLNAIFGVIRPTQGRVVFDGQDRTGQKPSANVPAGMGYAPQGAEVFKTLSITDNLMLAGFAIEDQRRVAESVSRIQQLFPALHERRNNRAGALSGGERQMLSLGMLLVSSPRLVMLDEPSGGLSPLFVDKVYDSIKGIRDNMGASVLLVEQDLNHALDVADRVYVLANGRITYESRTEATGGVEELGKKLLGF